MSVPVSGSRIRSQRVGPTEEGNISRHIMVDLRDKRRMCVLHLNPRPRDTRFQQEMALYLQYRKAGPGIMTGPLTMPNRKPKKHQIEQASNEASDNSSQHPLSVFSQTESSTNNGNVLQSHSNLNADHVNKHKSHFSADDAAKENSDIENCISESAIISGASSLLSSPTHTNSDPKNTHSASSVFVSLHHQPSNSQQNHNNTELRLPLNSISDICEPQPNSVDSTYLSPLSPQTHRNDASTCHELYNSPTHHSSEAAFIPSSRSPPSTSNNADTDLVIFFIHGVGGSSEIWRGQTDYFASLGYEIVAPDLIGHGQSYAPNDKKAYHFRQIAADMEELFDNFCKRRNVLIGHSYGASFATVLARTRARRVTRLVLVSGGPPSPLAPQPSVFTMPTCMLACIKPCLTKGFYKGAFNSRRDSGKLSAPKKTAFRIPAYVLQHTMNGQDWSDGDEIYHNWLTCPTLLLYGEMDGLVSLEEEQEMHRAIFDSRLVVIPDASHMVMMEAPDKFNNSILSFIQQPSPPHQQAQQQHQQTNIDNDYMGDQSSNRVEDVRPASRSKSRKSLRSARTPRSRPQRLLSKTVM